jgi:hypothetical protein
MKEKIREFILFGTGEYAGINGVALFEHDIAEMEVGLQDIVNKMEDFEDILADVYVVEKDKLDVMLSRVFRRMFFSRNGEFIPPEKGDYENWVDDAIYEIKKELGE